MSGFYGGLNLGDEAILQSIVTQVRGAVHAEITVFSRDAEDTLRRHRVEQAVGIRDLTRGEARREVERLDLLILGGGGILYDGDAEIYLREAESVFVAMERRQMDLQNSHAIVSLMHSPQRAVVLKGEYTPGQILSLMGHFAFAVGMRLHFLIFAALRGVPFVALPYASKVSGFIEDLGLQMPPLKHVTAGQLIAHIDRSWDSRDDLRARIQRALPCVQARARETNGMAVGLLTQGPAPGPRPREVA